MASIPTTGLRLELIAEGEASNTWGLKTNTNLSMLDRAISGYIVYPIVGGENVLSAVDYQLGDWHNLGWKLTGALASDATFIVPALEKLYIVENATTGNYALVVRPVAGTGIAVPPGQRAILLCDGTNITGTVIQPYTANVASIGAVVAPGFLTRKADGSFVTREIKGTDEQITVTQGLGETGPVVLSLNTNLITPGTLKVKTGFSVDAGGARIAAGGLVVDAGGARFAGANALVAIASSAGFGTIEMSGPSGALIDLKNSESEDFDIRLITSGTGGELVSAADINFRVPAARSIQSIVNNEVVAAATSSGFGTYKGLVDVSVQGNNDSQIQWRNDARTFSAGVRGSGGFSIRNNGQDVFVIGPDNQATFVNGVQISGNALNVLNGGIFAQNGAINFKGATSFESRGIFDDAAGQFLYLRASQNVGILATVPQQQLHMGNLGTQKSAMIRTETGGPAGFRSWDFGVGYGDFNFIINDATGGARRMTIDWQTGRTTLHNGLTVAGAPIILNGALTVTGATTLNGQTGISKTGGGTTFSIINPGNSGVDGCQVQYNGQNFNVFTRVSQSNGDFDFVSTGYSNRMMTITQGGAVLNLTGTYGAYSDARLKENIKDARDYTFDLMQLRVVDYSLKSEKSLNANRVGFIAQEVDEVLPELVINTGPHDGLDDTLAVSVSNMTPMIITAIQAINRRLEALENA